MKNKKICIIGGLGFVGRNLTEMIEKSNQVTILDIGKRPKYLSDNIVYVDDTINNLNVFKEQYFDFIFYFAGNASVKNSVDNPKFDLEKNTIHLLNLLEIIKTKNSKLIFASSAACYGEMEHPSKAYNNEPVSPYGISKLFSENYLKYYNDHYSIEIMICRFFSPFGEYNQKQVVYDTAVRLLKHQDKLTIYNPNSRRDFIYIKEAINEMLFLCDKSQFNAEPYDIGRGKTISIIELTKIIQNIVNIYPIIDTIDKTFTGDPKIQVADIGWANKLGFEFNTSTSNNLEKTINWIEKLVK